MVKGNFWFFPLSTVKKMNYEGFITWEYCTQINVRTLCRSHDIIKYIFIHYSFIYSKMKYKSDQIF